MLPGEVYSCRKNPPTAMLLDGELHFGWPTTDADAWCGAHLPRDVAEKVRGTVTDQFGQLLKELQEVG